MRIGDFGGVKAPDLTDLKNTVKYESLRGKVCLLINTPTLDSKVTHEYAISLVETVLLLTMLDIPVVIGKPQNSCFIDLSRNLFAAQFLEGEYTHLLQIDSDMGWEAEDILKMLLKDKEFIAGIGRKKLEKEEYAGLECVDENGTVKGELGKTQEDVLVKMRMIGGAITLQKRSVFEKLIEKYPSMKTVLGTTPGYSFYKCEYHHEAYQTEDYYFCSLCQSAGIDVWCYPNMNVDHYEGRKNYRGNYFKYLKGLKEKSLRIGLLPEIERQYNNVS